MKKLAFVLLLVAIIITLVACGGDTKQEVPDKTGATEQQPTGDADGGTPQGGAKGDAPTYKETMVPFDQLVSAERIVILQNTLNYSREGFYDADNKPVTEEIEYKNAAVDAYPISYALDFLTNDNAGDFFITNSDGSTDIIAAEDFMGFYVIIDFTSDDAPLLYNPDSGTELTNFLFAVTSEGEALYSIVSGSIHNASEIIANVGWNTDDTYRYMAADKFYIPVGPEERNTGEIRGTLSGAVNGSFPDLTIASGKINDVIYIEVME